MPTREEALAQLTASGPFEIVVDRSAGYPQKLYANAPDSLRDVLLSTRAYADRPFMLYEDEAVTFEAHLAKVAALAEWLAAAGVRKGDRVAIGMRNYPEWSIAFWAAQALGAITVSLNAWWTAAELAFALKDSEPAALILDGERLERLRPELDALAPRALVVARRGGAGLGGEDLEAIVSRDDADFPDMAIGPDDLATILYTSGTTGAPKGAMATQRNHVTNLWNSRLMAASARLMAGLPPLPSPEDPQVGMLATFPFFHIGGLTGLIVGMTAGMRMGLMYKWSPLQAVEMVERHQLASLSGVPIVVRQFLEAAAGAGKTLPGLMGVTSGGAPVPPDLIRRIGAQFDQKAMPGNGYGLTETTSAVVMNSGLDYLAHPESIGRPMPTAEIRIAGEDGEERPVGEIGEVWARGPNVIPGYWRNPKATEAAFGGGWFRSGDLGYRDAAGLYYVVDRIKDVIIRGGENIYCAEVEALLLEQAGVLDAAVVGVPDADYGEVVGAVIQVRPEDVSDQVAAGLVGPLRGRLAPFKIPTTVKLTTEELPRTATGKILKRDLRERYFAATTSTV